MSFAETTFLKRFVSVSILGMVCFFASIAMAGEEFSPQIPRYYSPSTTLTGITGLNIVPTSRMDEKGTVRAGVATTDPYIHTFLGFQIAEPLYINVRQTHEISSLNNSAKNLYPGLDFKLRLAKETATRPEISFGAHSAFGHKRMASEYLAFSKRKNNFDFTGGVAWGRLAGKGHIKNPLRALSSHFDKNRNFNSDHPQNPDNWLTGEEISFFGGIEYFTPIKGLSLKGEYGAYDYTPETQTNMNFNDTQPWSVGFNYKPWDFIDVSAGIIGGEKVMARLSLQDQIFDWPGRPSLAQEPPSLLSPREDNEGSHKTALSLFTHQPTAQQIGQVARLVANQSPIESETIEIALNHKELKGPALRLIRRDLEKAILNNHGSPEEIWRDITFIPNKTRAFKLKNYNYKNLNYRFIFDNKISLSEEDSGILYRSSAIAEIEKTLPFGFVFGTSPRLNIADNIGDIRNFRLPKNKAVRSDEDNFAANRLSVDRLYASWLYSLSESTHVNISAGYLEEMFGGFGGEILYRPFGKTLSVSAEGWQVRKRDADASLALSLKDGSHFTGHLNLFYELPNTNTTLFAKAGQYLAEDFGGTFGLQNNFKNGARLEGFITTTNQKDTDIFGGTTHLYGGVKLTLPFGNVPYIPKGSEINIETAPFARDTGQTLKTPNRLYEITEPVAYRQISRSWPGLLH